MPRERTYDVESTWTLPDLTAVLPTDARIDADITSVQTSFFDTTDRLLHGRGISVVVSEGSCTLRLADDEITVPSTGRTVPTELAQVLLGVRRGKRLLPIATTETLRGITSVVGPDDSVLAQIIDDAVTATAIDLCEVTEQRREITLTGSDDALGEALDDVLRRAGAEAVTRPGAEPVLALTSLGADAHAPIPAEQTLGRLVTDYLDEQYDALMQADVALRRGHEVVHAARVATRRYRSVLRVFADLFDAERASALDVELQWYAQQLGEVRDAQVQRTHLDQAVHALPTELVLGPVAARVDEQLLSQQLKGRTRLDRAMRGRRYLALLTELAAWHDEPPLTAAAGCADGTARSYLQRAERTLTKRLRAVKHGADETLHRARKAAKRARYTAELATPALGKRAKRTATRARRLQDVLGEHQDSVIACGILLHLGRATAAVPTENGFTYGLLHRAERERADRLRAKAIKAAHR